MRYTFSSGFAEHIKALIESKRAYGYDYSESERLLHNFDKFCVEKFSLYTSSIPLISTFPFIVSQNTFSSALLC